MLGALGVVYGDIGTSPLYALQAVFAVDHGAVHATPADVLSVISMLFWTITLVVSVKYVSFVKCEPTTRARAGCSLSGRSGESCSVEAGRKAALTVMVIGVLGASLFYGDSVITPAISVLSAVEGLRVSTLALAHMVVPLAATILLLALPRTKMGHAPGREPVRAGHGGLVRGHRAGRVARGNGTTGRPGRAVPLVRRARSSPTTPLSLSWRWAR